MPIESDVNLEELARVTHGFVGADLQALAKEAAIRAVRRVLPEINLEEAKIPAKLLNKIKVKMEDFDEAIKDVQPSALREVLVQSPNVRWEDIGGLTSVKNRANGLLLFSVSTLSGGPSTHRRERSPEQHS